LKTIPTNTTATISAAVTTTATTATTTATAAAAASEKHIPKQTKRFPSPVIQITRINSSVSPVTGY
jgi:hypothetical protein